MFVLMLISSQADFKVAFDRANLNLFGVSGAYDKTLADAAVPNAGSGVTSSSIRPTWARICRSTLLRRWR